MTSIGGPEPLITIAKKGRSCNPFYADTPVSFNISTPEVAYDLLKRVYKSSGAKLKECPPDLLFFYLIMTECSLILFEDYRLEIYSTLEISTGNKNWCDGFEWWDHTPRKFILEGKQLLGQASNNNYFTFRDQRLFQMIADMNVDSHTKVALFFESCRHEIRLDQEGQTRRTPLAYVERLVSEFK